MRTLTRATMAGLLTLAANQALAAEFCVSCDGPVAHYSCVIEGAAVSDDARLKLYCMTELAKSGAHASCSIDRAQQKPCSGAAKILAAPAGYQTVPALNQPAPAGAATMDANPDAANHEGTAVTLPSKTSAETEIPKSPPRPPAEPKTVKEMVDKGAASAGEGLENGSDTAAQAAKSAGSALEKAGKAVSDAAKKTWTCMSSLFSDC